jgi:hypothetical protein
MKLVEKRNWAKEILLVREKRFDILSEIPFELRGTGRQNIYYLVREVEVHIVHFIKGGILK